MGEQGENNKRANWLLWWRIDDEELRRQVSEYHALKFYQSARGISVLCLAFSVAISLVLAAFNIAGFDYTSIFDGVIMAFLAVFIYRGHRWAIVAAMTLWTIEKLTLPFLVPKPNGTMVFSQLIWWCIYMHAFYLAYRVEKEKKRQPILPEPGF